MSFPWFKKKKKPLAVEVTEPERLPVETFSVTGYICESDPLSGAKGSQLEAATINSYALSILAGANSPADIAAQEFFQERGANVLPIIDYSFSPERGFSARVIDGEKKRTVLIGTPDVITRASAPFSESIATAVLENPSAFVVAIDGIAYATFAITSELV